MEEKIQARGSPGSKLPKFNGAKPLGGFLQRTPNGAHLALSGKPGFPKAERPDVEFALNWAKQKPPHNEHKDRPVFDKRIPLSHAALAADRDGPRFGGPARAAGKQSNLMASNKEDLNENLLANAAKFTRGPFPGRTSYAALNGCKTQANGFYSGKPPVGLQRPRANSATSRNFTGRANPADQPRSFSHVRRSQSFSHSIQNSLLPPGPLTRSYSFNREADLTRPYETQQVPVRAAPKPNLLSRTSKQYDVPNDNEPPVKSSFTRAFPARPHPGLKNAALANGSAMAFPLGYQMSRPSLLKPNRKQFPREIVIDGTRSSTVAPVTERTERGGPTGEHRPEKKDLDVGGYLLCDNIEKEYSKDECFGDDLDDLSISSLSSSDKNDLSEDFADDFIELDGGNKTVIVVQESGNGVTEKAAADEYSMSSFQDNRKSTVPKGHNWLEQSETESTNSPYGEAPVSPDMEYRDPSSLELSPSDSSDGTYMWDEEGMEPIGSVHPCGSYESSEMNSLDILNNLDSCDLEDDDLMLDADLPEDSQCDLGSETMSLLERSERKVRLQQQGLWKRPPQRLGGQEPYYPLNAERYHNGRGSAYLESPTDRENYASPKFCPPSPRGPQPMGFRETTVMLDEMTLRHMVQDCTAVKTQLLKLKRLLQQEDDTGSLPDLQLSSLLTPEPQDPGTLWKSEELLLNEIRQLKEDAKKKDDKIQRLEEQLKAGCKCQKGGQETKSEKPKQHDKYTQTSCRRSSPQVLRCSTSNLGSTDHPSGRLMTPPLIGVPSKHGDRIQCPSSGSQSRFAGKAPPVPESELSDLLSTRLTINDVEDNPGEVKGTEEAPTAHGGDLRHQRPTSGFLDPNKNLQSKLTVKTSPTGQVPRPTSLQLYKARSPIASAHQGATSSVASPHGHLPCKQPQKPTQTSRRSLGQSHNGSRSAGLKSPELTPNDGTVGRPPARGTSHTVSGSSKILHETTDPVIKPESGPPVHSHQGTSPKLSTAQPPPCPSQVPTAESSKQAVKQSPRGSMLRPPSNFASKLKTPSSPKSDVLQPAESQADQSKSFQKAPSAAGASPKPLPNRKENQQEATESSPSKKQSRLPQPKTH